MKASAYVGIDVGRDRLHCVALADAGTITGATIFSAANMEAFGQWVAGAAVIAVDAPAQLSTAPHRGEPGIGRKFELGRCAEIALGRNFGSWVPWVAPMEEPPVGWMATGFEVYRQLRSRGVEALEVFPYAAFRELVRPARLPKKTTAEGIVLRAAVLRDVGV